MVFIARNPVMASLESRGREPGHSITFLGFPGTVTERGAFQELSSGLLRDYAGIWSRRDATLNLVLNGANEKEVTGFNALPGVGSVRTVEGAGTFALLRILFACAGNRGYRLIVVADQRAHWAAILFKLFSLQPVAILRLRDPDAPYIKQGKLAHWLHNQWVAANLLVSQADTTARRTKRPPNTLDMENPVCLEQPERTRMEMLANTIDALLPSSTRRSHHHIKLTYVTHFYCNQKSADSVVDLMRRYATYPAELLDHIHFVVVDDGSPTPCEIPEVDLNLTWLRINEDIRWNQSGARNLGMVYAKSDNVLITDIDHVFPPDSLRKLLERSPCGRSLYRIHVRDTPASKSRHTHPNIFLLSRGRFFEFNGYDEEFAGGYGAEDSRFAKHQQAFGTWLRILPKGIYCCPRVEIDRGRSYHSLFRDHSINTPVDSRKKLELVHFGPFGGHSRSSLNFTWSKLRERSRPVPYNDRRPDVTWWGGPARIVRLVSPRQQRQG